MDSLTLERDRRLKVMARAVLEHDVYGPQIEDLERRLGLERDQVLQAFVDYNIGCHTNEIYGSRANRVVLHVHNLVTESWHQERQKTLLELLRGCGADTAVDVGFGVPSRYMQELVLAERKPALTLVDLYESAFDFAEALLDQWDSTWGEVISFKRQDMNAGEFVGDYGVYIFQDSVEHVIDPTSYLSSTVERAPGDSQFVLSLPIGTKTPDHYIEWTTNNEAKSWLRTCGLRVKREHQVEVNRKIDLFADFFDVKLHNLYVTCTKE